MKAVAAAEEEAGEALERSHRPHAHVRDQRAVAEGEEGEAEAPNGRRDAAAFVDPRAREVAFYAVSSSPGVRSLRDDLKVHVCLSRAGRDAPSPSLFHNRPTQSGGE